MNPDSLCQDLETLRHYVREIDVLQHQIVRTSGNPDPWECQCIHEQCDRATALLDTLLAHVRAGFPPETD